MGVYLAEMKVKGSRGGGVTSYIWPQKWTELWEELGMHNTGKEDALFHPLSPSQFQMPWITVHKSSDSAAAAVFCLTSHSPAKARTLFPLPSFLPYPFILSSSDSSRICAFPI